MKFVKSSKKFIARIKYYGIAYLRDALSNHFANEANYPSILKKEESYSRLSDNEIPDELVKWFYTRTAEKFEISNPVTFNQKIQWIKLFDIDDKKVLLADKYRVRSWVADTIGEKYLIPLIGVWKKADDIDFDKLPNKFALKCNHGSGWNIIVNDKNIINKTDVINKLNTWMNSNFAYHSGFELQYRNIPPRIIAEAYIENDNGGVNDYKCYCFDGKLHYIQFLTDRKNGLRMAYFNKEWELQPFVNNHPPVDYSVPKPDNLDELIYISEKLSQGFAFVRVDFYRLNSGEFKFGEMTFTPASGTQDWRPEETNYMLGSLLNISGRHVP